MVPEAGIAPASPRLQRGANLPQLLRELVVRRGNAPRSLAYRASALLLSYQTKVWPDPKDSNRLIALAKEQLALVTEYRFHGIQFAWWFMFGGRRR